MASFSYPTAMNTHDEQFFKDLGARIARARKEHGMTQQQLARSVGRAPADAGPLQGGQDAFSGFHAASFGQDTHAVA